MRQAILAGLAMAGLAGIWGPGPALADDQSAYYAACVRISPALKAACSCRAKAAMQHASPELRADIILSMSDPSGYAAKAKAGKVSDDIIRQWEVFSADSAKQCGIDN